MKAVYYISNSRTWGHGDPALLVQNPVPMIDIEVGSSQKCRNDETACRALARTLTHVFDADERIVHNILCVGGIRKNWSEKPYEK